MTDCSEYEDIQYIGGHLKTVQTKIRASAEAAGRSVDEIRLVAAVKYADMAQINELLRLGVKDLGENRVQQLLEHWEQIKRENREDVRMHMIGSLQTNKVKYIIDKVVMIHSLDSEKLAAEIEKQAALHGLYMDVLIEINSGREDSKGGVMPENLETFSRLVTVYPHLRLRGFMTMAPKCAEKNDYLRYFGQTVALGRDVWHHTLGREDEPLFSMGMSDSYEEAILCGATYVRVGRTLFGL